MKHLYSLVGACLGASLLAACGGNSFTNSTPAAAPSPLLTSLLTAPREGSPHESSWRLKRKKVVYKAIYSFGSVPDAQGPVAGLIDVGGVLYGTTSSGGANNCSGVGCGAVFAITTSGKESVLYSFAGGSDGAKPLAALTNVGDKLYGTTQMGGQSGYGTVFKVTTSGKEKVLHSFGGGSDGVYPVADLINVRGTLYGTTRFGGSGNAGTVFKITTSGKEKVLYTFGSRTGDGEDPYAGLIDVGGTLYGTTEIGGANNCSGVGCGTVFAITTSGKERVLYSFAGGSDGDFPLAGLINVGGMLY
ncbi:MAG: choice-of-anchor tandem repeat GloVer-containing protein, partial [Candidatus Cybelea sp.]